MRLYGLDRLILLLAIVSGLVFSLPWLTKPKPVPLTNTAASTVHEIRILQRGQLKLGLLRDADGWMVTHPQVGRARTQRVRQLLAILHTPSHRSWPASGDLLSQSGLDSPGRTLQFDQLRIDLGEPSTPPGQRYVRVGDRIHLIDELWFSMSSLPASHYLEAP